MQYRVARPSGGARSSPSRLRTGLGQATPLEGLRRRTGDGHRGTWASLTSGARRRQDAMRPTGVCATRPHCAKARAASSDTLETPTVGAKGGAEMRRAHNDPRRLRPVAGAAFGAHRSLAVLHAHACDQDPWPHTEPRAKKGPQTKSLACSGMHVRGPFVGTYESPPVSAYVDHALH